MIRNAASERSIALMKFLSGVWDGPRGAKGYSYGTVYLVFCEVSGKGYVGQTVQDLQARWRSHRYGQCHALRAAIHKYGADSFTILPLGYASDKDDLDSKEIAWIAAFRTVAPGGYNLELGGSNGKPSLETRRKQSAAHKGKLLSDHQRAAMATAQQKRRVGEASSGGGPVFTTASRDAMRKAKQGTTHSSETKARMSATRTGRTPSQATREKLRASATGRHHSDETRRKMSEAHLGKTPTEDTRRKMSDTRKGVKRPPEVVAKVAAANKGKKRSPEAREKMRQARLSYWERKRGEGAA